MAGMDDESPDGGAVENDLAAVSFDELTDHYQSQADAATTHVRIIAVQCDDPEYRAANRCSAVVVQWNQTIGRILGWKDDDAEDVVPHSESDQGTEKIRMVYHFRQMRRGDFASVCPEVAALWVKCGIARRVSEEEFARASAIVEANAQVPAHPADV